MRLLHITLFGLGAVAMVASFVLDSKGGRRPSGAHGSSRLTDTVAAGAMEEQDSPLVSGVLPSSEAHQSTRALVPATVDLDLEDPCVSVAAELQAERVARAAAEKEAADLRKELAAVTRELNACRFPECTPYGAFLASPEADQIIENIRSGLHLYESILEDLRYDIQVYALRAATDPSVHNKNVVQALSKRLQLFSDDREAAVDNVFGGIQSWLDEFPVMLQPGEAIWIAEQVVVGPAGEEDLLRFLGPTRVAAELPLDKLFDDYLWDGDYGPQLQAALPPGKRAELAAKLDALMEQTDDPEEIEWLIERFPAFFP